MKRSNTRILSLSIALSMLMGTILTIGFNNNNTPTAVGIPYASTVHEPIYIDGDTAMDAFFAGNGTDGLSYESAYVLEDLEIDAGGVGSAIRLENTSRYLIIRNCTLNGAEFTYGEAGIALHGVNNVHITKNNIQFNNLVGVFFFESSNNEVFQNHIGNNSHGILLESNSNFNVISQNVIHSDNGNGILFENSSYNTAVDNRISNAWFGISIYKHAMYSNLTNNQLENNQLGIGVDIQSNFTTIYHNTVTESYDGIVLNGSSHALIDNNAVSDSLNVGVILNNVSDSTAKGNLIENSRVGIHAINSSDNSIFMNKFTVCSFSYAIDDGANNWNTTKYGNYWGNYETRYLAASTSDNRIWNTPYQINTSSVYDYKPMVATGLPYVTTPGNRTNVEGGHCSLLYWIIYDSTILDAFGQYTITKNGLFWEGGQWNDQDFIELVSDYLPPGIHIFTLQANDGTRFGVIEDTIQMTITPFGTPVLITQSQTINEYSLLVEWEITPDSDLYYLFVNDEFYNVVVAPKTEMLVEFAEEGVYNIHIIAVNGVLESNPSNVITITVEVKSISEYSFVILISIIGILSLVALVRKKMKIS